MSESPATAGHWREADKITSTTSPEEKEENVPFGSTGLGAPRGGINYHDQITMQTLEGWLLPLLPSVPAHIHNIHLKFLILTTTTTTEDDDDDSDLNFYDHLVLPLLGNKKLLTDIIDGVSVSYYFSKKNGTVEINISNSRFPFKLENDYDRSRILAFLGQVRQSLVDFLHVPRQRSSVIIPDVMEWRVTERDKQDIRLSEADLLQFSGLHIPVKHLNHVFSVYVKAPEQRQQDAAPLIRVEQKLGYDEQKKHPLDVLSDVFNNPTAEALGQQQQQEAAEAGAKGTREAPTH
jgi:hypothetical protein